MLTDTPAARTATLSAWLPSIREIDDICHGLTDPQRAFALDFLRRITSAVERAGRST